MGFFNKARASKFGFSKRVAKEILEGDMSVACKIKILKGFKERAQEAIDDTIRGIAYCAYIRLRDDANDDGYDEISDKLALIKASSKWVKFIDDRIKKLTDEDDEPMFCIPLGEKKEDQPKHLLKWIKDQIEECLDED